MVKSESGERLRACAQNALIFARNHPAITGRVRLDVWAQQLVWMSAPPWASATRDMRDEDADEMALWLAQTEALVVSRDACWHALRAVAVEHPLDRLRDWLDPIVWDGEARLESLFIDHAGAEDSEYTRAVTRAWCVSAVARVYQPGCQADHMLVLEGSQGVGKTSILRALAGDQWHAEITLAATKDSIMDLHGPWIIEWSELSGLARSEVEQVKALISRRVDRIRLPYARTTVNLFRRCVMVGTTNTDDWATDQSGNRRYWPVPVGECDVSSIAAVRDQVWAEAREAYRAGSQWWLDAEATGLALEAQAERLPADPWIDVLDVALHSRFAERDWVSTGDLYDALGIMHQAQTSGMSRRLSIQMKLLGWTSARKRNTGEKIRGWARPHKQPASS